MNKTNTIADPVAYDCPMTLLLFYFSHYSMVIIKIGEYLSTFIAKNILECYNISMVIYP